MQLPDVVGRGVLTRTRPPDLAPERTCIHGTPYECAITPQRDQREVVKDVGICGRIDDEIASRKSCQDVPRFPRGYLCSQVPSATNVPPHAGGLAANDDS